MKNNIKAFKELFDKYYSPLCNYAYKIIGNRDESEDIVQNLFMRFWELNSLENVVNIERYILRSVKFKCIDHLKLKSKELRTPIYDIEDVQTEINENLTDQDIEPLLAYFAAKLPPKTKQIFLLSRKSKLTYKQISTELKISEKTVEAQMGRALRYMRKLLKENGFLTIFLNL